MKLGPDSTEKDNEHTLPHLIFSVNNQTYAVKASHVLKIVEVKSITVLHRTSPYIPGVVRVSGTVYPVIDLRLFDAQRTAQYPAVAILILCRGVKACMVVDQVMSVVNINMSQISAPTGINRWVSGVFQEQNKSVLLLSEESLFNIGKT